MTETELHQQLHKGQNKEVDKELEEEAVEVVDMVMDKVVDKVMDKVVDKVTDLASPKEISVVFGGFVGEGDKVNSDVGLGMVVVRRVKSHNGVKKVTNY